MKKRFLSLILALTIGMGLFSATAWADQEAPAKNTTVPQTPQNVSVQVTSMQQGSMSAYGHETHNGTIMGMNVRIQMQEGITQYFIAPMRKANIGGNTELIKADMGNMPFVRANQGDGKSPVWEDTEKSTGNNGETLTEQGNTLTAQVKVCVYDSEPQHPNNGFVKGEKVFVEVRAENGDLPKSSDPVIVEIPADPSSVGKTYTEKGEEKTEDKDKGTETEKKTEDKPEDESEGDSVLTITNATLSASSFSWNGKVQVPEVIAVYSGQQIVPSTGYIVNVNTPNSTDAGTYYITITGQGNYVGSLKLPYTINQNEVKDLPNVAGAKAKGGKRRITVEWKPLKAKERKKRKIGKVEVRYKNKKEGIIYKTIYKYPKKVENGKKVNVKVKNLPKKGIYQLQIRYLGAVDQNSQHVSKKWSKWMTAKVK